MATILCVDDESDMEMLISQIFRKQIRSNEYKFVFASNGEDALDKLIQYPEINLVLSDINMPGMDGLTFLSKLKEKNNAAIKTVMVSAYGDMDNIRAAMNRGAFDFVTKPINLEDLEATIIKTLEEIKVYNAFLVDHDKLVSLQTDLTTAREIQQSMLPKDPNPYPERDDFKLHGLVEPAKSVGGDLFEYILISDDRLFFMIGDVSDKGIPASLIMAITKILFKTHFTDHEEADLTTEVRKINRILSRDNTQMMFVTTFCGILDLKTGEVEYVDGGHERPLIIRSATGDVEILQKKDGGLPFGIVSDHPYTSNKAQLNPGDCLFLYTDGLEDALNKDAVRYTIDPSIQIIKEELLNEAPMTINQTLLQRVKEYIGDYYQFDDIGMLTIKYNGPRQAA